MRIHLAGDINGAVRFANDPSVVRALHGAHPYRLQSYLEYKKAPDLFMRSNETFGSGDDHILDSGLFSFMFGSKQDQMEKTLDAYMDYGKQYLKDIDAGIRGNFVELDAHTILGMESVFRLRELLEPYSHRVIYTWHLPEGLDGLLKLAEERSYISIGVPELRIASGGKFSGGSSKVESMVADLLNRVHRHCKRRGILPPKIHLLGCTVVSMMQTRMAYSCDSTSWLSGIRYGSMICFSKDKKIKTVNVRSRAAERWRQTTLERLPLLGGVLDQVTPKRREWIWNAAASAHAFSELQHHLDKNYPSTETRNAQR